MTPEATANVDNTEILSATLGLSMSHYCVSNKCNLCLLRDPILLFTLCNYHHLQHRLLSLRKAPLVVVPVFSSLLLLEVLLFSLLGLLLLVLLLVLLL